MRRIAMAVAWMLALSTAPAAAQSHLLIISGLAGEPRLADQFHAWSTGMADAAVERFGMPRERITYLAEDQSRDPSRIAGKSTKENIDAELKRIASEAGPNDRVLVLFFGHGSANGEEGRINLPGPDLTASELATMLDRFPTQQVVVVNTTSASGAFQEALAGKNRTVITATKSGLEQNETVFARFFVEAFTGDGADTNKDGQVTILEAYDFATAEVERFYDSDSRLQTEHSVLGGDRELARAFSLGGGAARAAAETPASPELRGLVEQREALEAQVQALTARKDQMEEAEYQRELERLLLELARTNREIREREGTK